MSTYEEHTAGKPVKASTTRLLNWYAGGLILAALILGGGTTTGLWSDHIVQFLCLPALGFALFRPAPRLGRMIGLLPFGVLIAFVLQLAGTLAHIGTDPLDMVAGNGLLPGTRAMDQTIENLSYALVYILLFYFFSGLSKSGQKTLVSFLLIGTFIAALVAFFQYISTRPAESLGFLPFDASAAFFANRNHFGTLIFISIPFLISHLFEVNRKLPWVAIFFVIFFQFVIGSLAGAGLSIFAVGFSFLIIANRGRRHFFLLGIAICVSLAMLAWNFNRLYGDEHLREFGRLVFYKNTLTAIAEYIPFGSGFGSFRLVYASFIQPEGIYHRFVNHAHNDWLELLLEGGALSLLLMAIYTIALVRQWKHARDSGLSRSALCAIIFILLHSVVDYPLRTMAIGVIFMALNAIYFYRPSRIERAASMKVRVGGVDRYLSAEA